MIFAYSVPLEGFFNLFHSTRIAKFAKGFKIKGEEDISMGRLLAWLLSSEALVVAIAALQMMAGTDDIRPMAIVVLCVGMVLWCARKAYQNSKPVIIASIGFFVLSGVLTLYILGGPVEYYTGFTPFFTWAAIIFFIGSPFMLYIFKKYK